MPRVRTEEVLFQDATTKRVKVSVQDGTETRYAEYEYPASPAVFASWFAGLPVGPVFHKEKGEDGKERDVEDMSQHMAYRLYVSGLDTRERQRVREVAASESTFIVVGGKRIDVMDTPLPKLIRGINGYRGAAVFGKEVPNAMVAAAKKLIEQGKAKENEATGLLELTA